MKYKKITISTYSLQEEENYDYWRSLPPVKRLALHIHMLKNIYTDLNLTRRRNYKRIYFDV